ncbi:hypothetical protein [Pseudaestuariivita rosea]|uniref:hypothetical protein n=1 Tax=Pseudaestuariivita rosea TaxID=2763263 RepID=UPI001F2093A4|nr:hypothetical protein [Pseudaestuariivita rosea]
MVKHRKKFLWQHSSGRWYVRKQIDGKMSYLGRITAEEGTEDFDTQYWEIVSGKKAQAKHSWSELIKDLRATEFWERKSPRYRRDLEPVFEYLEAKIGKKRCSSSDGR